MTYVPTSRYRPAVRVGNWFEDICQETEKITQFRAARDRGELLVEKTRHLFDNFHKEVNLEAPKEHIRFGSIVQLMPVDLKICDYITTDIHPALSVIINERVVRHSQKVNDECELTIAPSMKPCVRNTFRLLSGDEVDREGESLKYGQQFRLECIDTEEDPLLLFSAPKTNNLRTLIHTTFDSRKCGEINLPLGLCYRRNCGPGKDIPSAYLNWYCHHIDPRKRFETTGSSLPSNKPLVITHVATNRNLAAENVVIQTLFGPEFLVSVQNYKNIYRRETWKNIWMISKGYKINMTFKTNTQ